LQFSLFIIKLQKLFQGPVNICRQRDPRHVRESIAW